MKTNEPARWRSANELWSETNTELKPGCEKMPSLSNFPMALRHLLLKKCINATPLPYGVCINIFGIFALVVVEHEINYFRVTLWWWTQMRKIGGHIVPTAFLLPEVALRGIAKAPPHTMPGLGNVVDAHNNSPLMTCGTATNFRFWYVFDFSC
jgi:hypothetical protein